MKSKLVYCQPELASGWTRMSSTGFLGLANTENGERASLLPVQPVKPSPDTLTSTWWCSQWNITHWQHWRTTIELIKRLRILTLTLLPVEVDPAVINEPTSRVITSQVISAYMAAAGDYVEAVSPPESHSIVLVAVHLIFVYSLLASLLSSLCKSTVHERCQQQSCRLRRKPRTR